MNNQVRFFCFILRVNPQIQQNQTVILIQLALLLYYQSALLLNSFGVFIQLIRSTVLAINNVFESKVLVAPKTAYYNDLQNGYPLKYLHFVLSHLEGLSLLLFNFLILLFYPTHKLFGLAKVFIGLSQLLTLHESLGHLYLAFRYTKFVLDSCTVLNELSHWTVLAQDNLEAKSVYNISVGKTVLSVSWNQRRKVPSQTWKASSSCVSVLCRTIRYPSWRDCWSNLSNRRSILRNSS